MMVIHHIYLQRGLEFRWWWTLHLQVLCLLYQKRFHLKKASMLLRHRPFCHLTIMESKTKEKWGGKFSAKLQELKAEQVWPLIEDFCNIHRWLPTADTCHLVEGVAGQLGCVRYCCTSPASLGGSEGAIKWATERLIAVDAKERYVTYEIVDNNIGFGSYVATMKVLAGEAVDGNGECEIEWSFVADPVAGWKQEDLIAYLESSLQSMAKRIEEALLLHK